MAKLKSTILRGQKNAAVNATFRIPISLADALENKELNNDQKILLVKSYSDEMFDESGKKMEKISNQYAVILIMILELGAL